MSVGDNQHPAVRTPAVSRADAEGGLGGSSFLELRLAQSRAGGQAGPLLVLLLLGWATRADSGSRSTHGGPDAILSTCHGPASVTLSALASGTVVTLMIQIWKQDWGSGLQVTASVAGVSPLE